MSHRPRGNLTSDGTYAYQYDALLRLIGVRLLGGASVDALGRLVHPELLGCWVRAYEYDGLGRLVTVLSPQSVGTGTSAPVRRVEQYLHDGEQRIAEVVAESAGQWAAATQCEFVWDPHAADRLICQLDANRRPWIVLSNRVGTPTALVDGQNGLVAEQYAIGPFGGCESLEVLGSTQAAAGQVLKVGYQGLFTDRLDAILGKPVLVPGSRTLVHNRARVYMPRLGRFLQQDPNRAGIALPGAGAAALPSYGMPPSALAVDVDPMRQYGDGTNLYAALGGNPMGQRDPRGLFGLMDGLLTGLDMADSVSDQMDVAYSGVLMQAMVWEMLVEGSVSDAIDADWASDWSMPDTYYTRSGVSEELDGIEVDQSDEYEHTDDDHLRMAAAVKRPGTYFLIEDCTKRVKGKRIKSTRVVRTGRTVDLQRRSCDLMREFKGYGYRFREDMVISSKDGRRIREQYIYEQHPNARENKIQAIAKNNKNRNRYIKAGWDQGLTPKKWVPHRR